MHTRPDNLLPLCDRHHHQVHEGGWTLTLTPDRTVTLRRPDGVIAFHGDTRDRFPAESIDADLLDTVDPGAEWLARWNHDPHDDIVCDRRLAVLLRTHIDALSRRERRRARSDTSTNVVATTQRRRGP